MQSIASIFIKSYLKFLRARRRGRDLTLEEQRQRLEHFTGIFKVPGSVRVESARIGGIPAEWIVPDDYSGDVVLLYMHGGAYCAGSLNTHRAFLGRLALACGCKVINVDYRLAPENPFPAALDDVLAVYRYLINKLSVHKIVLAGDSAGGGLALALAMRLRDEKISPPAACVLMAPWVDLTCNNETFRTVGKKDVMLDQKRLQRNARMYVGKMDIKHPYISPVYGDLSGLPPVLIQVGTHDMLLGEARLLAEGLQTAGNDITLEVWPEVIHGWQSLGNLVPESRRAIRQIAGFIIRHVN